MRRLKRLTSPRALLALIGIGYLLYAGAFIYRTSALVQANSYIPDTKRYYVLFDDAMISMRYAKNLANGDGLVWNPGGPRVEGYTNPAWVGYMALFHLVGLDESKISLCIQASGALFLAITLVVVARIAAVLTADRTAHDGPAPAWVGLGAALCTAAYLPLNTWSLQGTEVSILTLIVSLAAWDALRALAAGRFTLTPYLLLGFSTWIRMDMAVPFGALAGFLILNDRRHRARHLAAAPLILAAFLAPQMLARRWYYGEWLPNTYPLKMDGYPAVKRITHGYEIAWRFAVRWGVLPFAVFLFRRDRGVRLLVWLWLAQMVYSIYVGGDAWEHYGGANRYLSVAMPLWFVVVWLALEALYRHLMASARRGEAGLTPAGARIGLAAAAGALLLSTNYTYGTGAYKEWLLIQPSLYAGENGPKVRMAKLLDALTTPDATVALAGAGIIPYFTDRPYVDLLGKTDPYIAHLPADQHIIPEFKPGHMKWDYAYSIGQLQPDVVLELWVQGQDAAPFLAAAYQAIWFPPKNDNVWMKTDSPHIRWERIWGE